MKEVNQNKKKLIVEIQKNTHTTLINVLDVFANKNSIISYHESVPHVNVFLEAFETWKSSFLINQDWFIEIFNENQLLELKKFDLELTSFYNNFNFHKEFNEIINSKEWIEISLMSNKILTKNNW
jgi:hypothetical protein